MICFCLWQPISGQSYHSQRILARVRYRDMWPHSGLCERPVAMVLPPLQGIWFTVSTKRLQVGRQLCFISSLSDSGAVAEVLVASLKKLLSVSCFGGPASVSWGCEAGDPAVPCSDIRGRQTHTNTHCLQGVVLWSWPPIQADYISLVIFLSLGEFLTRSLTWEHLPVVLQWVPLFDHRGKSLFEVTNLLTASWAKTRRFCWTKELCPHLLAGGPPSLLL